MNNGQEETDDEDDNCEKPVSFHLQEGFGCLLICIGVAIVILAYGYVVHMH